MTELDQRDEQFSCFAGWKVKNREQEPTAQIELECDYGGRERTQVDETAHSMTCAGWFIYLLHLPKTA